MGNRLSKIYTKTGDSGDTGLASGERISKTAARVHAMGDVDELNSLLGLLVCKCDDAEMNESLCDIQHVLFNIGGELSMPGSQLVGEKEVSAIEKLIDLYNAPLPPLKEFILPGGSEAAATCHLARAVCRRAERVLVSVGSDDNSHQFAKIFLNRLSDLLFVLARVLGRSAGGSEIFWQKDRI